MKYIKMRRLTYAAYLLKETNKKIVDVALEIGFNSHVSFSRCFKNVYGITPEDYRKNGLAIPQYEKVNLKGRHFSNDNRAYLTGPKIVFKDSFYVIGSVLKCSFDKNLQNYSVPNFWDNFLKCEGEIQNKIDSNIRYGVSFDVSYGNYFNYLAGFEVRTNSGTPEGMTKRNIPGCKYAVFTYNGIIDIKKYYDSLDYIYGIWLPNSNHTLENSLNLIEVIDVEKFTYDNRSKMDIYIPLQ